MHTVDRGDEPKGLAPIRRRYTPRWVAYYRDGVGNKPTDAKWQDFHDDLSRAFCGLCGYCEDNCKGQVDHFRPKHKFPGQVYKWDNWVLACGPCNTKKGRNWPRGGYVDPCSNSPSERPEGYFDLDTTTGEIIAKRGLTADRRRRADRTIEDIGLNRYHHLKARKGELEVIAKHLKEWPADDPKRQEFIQFVASRNRRLSSFICAWLQEQGLTWDPA